MSRADRVIRTPGKTPTYVSPREGGGWILAQGKDGKHKIRLAADEAQLIAEIFSEDR